MIPVARRDGWTYWEVEHLIRDGVLEIGDGYRAKNSEMGRPGLPFARAGNVNGGFHFEDADILSDYSVQRAGAKVSRMGDVVFTSKGTFGRFAFVREDTPRFVYSPQLCYWRLKTYEPVEPRFLYYWMQGPDCMNQLSQVKGLTDMADYVSLTNQRKMWVSAPPLPTQRKIAAILAAYDDLIDNNTRRIALLETIAHALYREWFVHFRYPGHHAVPLIDSPLGPIPEGWRTVNLSSVVETQYGYTESARQEAVGPKFIRGMDINKTSYIDWDSVPYCPISEPDHDRYRVSFGDILVVRMADPGKVGIVESDIDAVFASYLIRLRSRVASLSPYYLFYFLLSDRYQNYITGASTGTTRKSASAGVITDIEILTPPDDTRRTFEEQVSMIRQMLNNLLRRNALLRRTRDLLLPKLISGEVDVAALDIPTEEITS